MPTGKPNSSIEERFLRKIVIQPCKIPELSDCHIWTGGKYQNGYGQVLKKTFGTTYAHQWACHHWNGIALPLAKGMCIKHSCDTRECVNPEHLSMGTLQENIIEMSMRNETAFNKTVPTEAELDMLVEMINSGTPRRVMSERIGHARTWIDRVVRDYIEPA